MPVEILGGDSAIEEGDKSLSLSRRKPYSLSQLAEAADLFGRAIKGNKRAMLDLNEAMSTSDFPNLLGAVFGRELMATYEQLPKIWPAFATRTTLNDFRPKTLVDLLGGRGRLSLVPELTEYKAIKATEGIYTLSVAKYGERVPYSWEMGVNDDLDALRQLPGRMAQGAADTEDYLATAQLVTTAGPNTNFFKAGNNNTPVTGAGSALSATSLSDGLTVIGQRRDSEGRPIAVSAYILMVPPALEVAANNIVNATEIRLTSGTTTTIVGNWLSGKVKVVVNPWIPLIDVSGTAATTWYLLPAPTTNRPAVTLGFLRGHEAPDLRVKADTGNSLGGGSLDAKDGSFDVDDIQYRIRHVLGGTTLDPIATYAAKGA